MSDPANSAPETADERAVALLAAAARASYGRSFDGFLSITALMRPEIVRLSEVERRAVRDMLLGLVEQIEQEMRARMLATPELARIEEFTASLSAPHIAIAWPALSAAELPDDTELAKLLVQRARAYTITRHLRRFGSVAEDSVIEQLTEHPEPAISASAMKLLIAESRSNNRFDDPRLGRADLPEPVARRLIWTIAAAIRDFGKRFAELDQARLETVVAMVADAMVAEHDDSSALAAAAETLAAALQDNGYVDPSLWVEAVQGARLHLYVAMVAVRAEIAFEAAWDMISMPDVATHMVLLKSIGLDRDTASQLVTLISRAVSQDEATADNHAAAWIETYDTLDATKVEEAMRPWRVDPAYRTALSQLSSGNRGGSS